MNNQGDHRSPPWPSKCLRGQHRAADQPDLQKLEKPHWHIDMDQPDFQWQDWNKDFEFKQRKKKKKK